MVLVLVTGQLQMFWIMQERAEVQGYPVIRKFNRKAPIHLDDFTIHPIRAKMIRIGL